MEEPASMPWYCALWWQPWQPEAAPTEVCPATLSVGTVMLAALMKKPPGLTFAVVWHPELPQSTPAPAPVGMWLAEMPTIVMVFEGGGPRNVLGPSVPAVDPWHELHVVWLWWTPVTE
jgi:hypothetical protein